MRDTLMRTHGGERLLARQDRVYAYTIGQQDERTLSSQ
jgi:hypothetical protein